MKRWFAVREKASKELFAVVSVEGSRDSKMEQAQLWDELDSETSPHAFEFKVMGRFTSSAGGKWLDPVGDWLEFNLSADQYYDILAGE